MKTETLPQIIQQHLDAVKAFDTDAILKTFSGDAMVYDNRRELWGRDAIRAFIAKEIVGDRVTMKVTEVKTHGDMTIVRALYDGNYDKTNLPPELVLTNYFTVRDGKIVTLITVRVV